MKECSSCGGSIQNETTKCKYYNKDNSKNSTAMECFARWKKDKNSDVWFRDQTILHFGDNWNLLANIVLLNPGSALPKSRKSCNAYLESLNLPFFINSGDSSYHQFSLDPLMNDLLKLYSSRYSGGVLELYNLFNLKNQHSGDAITQFKANIDHRDMITPEEDIQFCGAPVIIACGFKALVDDTLYKELEKYIRSAEEGASQLYSISKDCNKSFSIKKVSRDKNGRFEVYHPSYTFKYGNRTKLA
jgi:hypothetical protein